ncbi:MAG: IS3 family transposase [Anaerolineae bacterium]|nr:IS3 family transposase [Anaerolineae bacterium]
MRSLSQTYPVSTSCAVLGLPRSSYYHQAKPRDEQGLREAIVEIARRRPTYGSRRVAVALQRSSSGARAGRHSVRRLMREMGLAIKPKRGRGSGTDSRHSLGRYPNLIKGIQPERPNQVWVADITYVRVGSEFVYLAVIMDVFTRSVRGWHISWTAGQSLTLAALRKALEHHPAPEFHHSDQGSQYAAKAYIKLLRGRGTQISMAAPGKPKENGYAERLIRTTKEEEVYLSDYQNMAEAREQLGYFIEVVYNQQRPHSALDYLTLAEFEGEWLLRNSLKLPEILCPII